jgi:hypothetical protein
VIRNPAEGDTTLVSPFDFHLVSVDSVGYPLRPKQPGATGLWFRETTPVEIVFTQRSSPFRAAVLKKLQEVRNATEKYKELAKEKLAEATRADDIAGGSDTAVKTAQKSLETAIANKANPEDINKAQQEVKDATDKYVQANANSKVKDQELVESKATAADATKLLAALNAIATAPTISRSATFIKAIPNPNRVFSFNIARSAFVQNKKIDLTILNGLLTKVTINKPSEAEGFSEIPLELSKKLAELPKDILTIRTQTTSAAAAKNTVNAQSAQAAAESPAQLQAQTDQIKAEAAKIEAETKLIQDQRALQALLNGQ